MKTYIILTMVAASLYSVTAVAQSYHHGRNGYSDRGYRGSYYSYNRPYSYSRPYSYNRAYSYSRPYSYNYNRSYYYQPARLSIVASLPFGAVMLHLGGHPYHYYNGVFYRPYSYGFEITTPPVGIIVPVLPPGCVSVMIGGRPCYYYSGTYYMPLADNNYQVIQPPAAATNDNNSNDVTNNSTDDSIAANEYEKVILDGKTYYKKDNTYYKAIVDDNGTIVYKAVGETGK